MNDKDEIFKKSYVASPVKEKKKEEMTITIKKNLFLDIPVKKVGKRKKHVRLDITKDTAKKQKEIRKDYLKNQIIFEYNLKASSKKS